jgi:predicted RNA-binding Zn ribbon-like protein
VPTDSVPDLTFKYVGGDPALDLINTVDWTTRGLEHDRLMDYERLTHWAEGAGVISSGQAKSLRAQAQRRPRDAEAAYRMAIQIRSVLWRVFGAIAREEPAGDALARFNRLLAAAVKQMRIAPIIHRSQSDRFLQLAWDEAGERLDSFLWAVVWSAASLLVSDEVRNIRICGGPDCGWMYVDRSRNQLRRWCQMETCGTREKTRRRRGHFRRSFGRFTPSG